MKDIRQDLQERFQSIEKEIAKLTDEIELRIKAKKGIAVVLSMEEELWSNTNKHQADIFTDNSGIEIKSTPLAAIIRRKMANGKKYHLDEIVKFAKERNFPFGNKSAGRVIHFALTGLKANKVVEQLGEGYWRMSPK